MIVTKETSDKCWLEEPQQRQCYGPTGRYECEDEWNTQICSCNVKGTVLMEPRNIKQHTKHEHSPAEVVHCGEHNFGSQFLYKINHN